jgi:glycogen synthase
VHLATLCRELRASGVTAVVLDLDPRSAPRPECLSIRGGGDLVRQLVRHARDGFTIHMHANGHNRKSWLIALVCGLVGRWGRRSVVTLHSGLLPTYLAQASRFERSLARAACGLFSFTVCVNREIEQALRAVGVPRGRLRVLPAFLPPSVKGGPLSPALASFAEEHSPLLSTTLFFRTEYGFDLLVEALVRLRSQYPLLGCVVMGSGDRASAEDLLGRRGLRGAVVLAGDLDHDECVKVMARSDVFVRPTRADGDSISVREAALLGVAVVASRVGTRPDGTFLFPAGDVGALVRAVEAALRQGRGLPLAGSVDTLRDLLELYEGAPRTREPGGGSPEGVPRALAVCARTTDGE